MDELKRCGWEREREKNIEKGVGGNDKWKEVGKRKGIGEEKRLGEKWSEEEEKIKKDRGILRWEGWKKKSVEKEDEERRKEENREEKVWIEKEKKENERWRKLREGGKG